MINPKINFYQIFSNYLLSKASDDFISNKFGRYDSSDLEIITGLVNSKYFKNLTFKIVKIIKKNISSKKGYKNSDAELNNTIRYKIYLAYLLTIIAKYLKTIDEDNLMDIVQTLHNSNADRVVPCYILNEIRNLVYKKVFHFYYLFMKTNINIGDFLTNKVKIRRNNFSKIDKKMYFLVKCIQYVLLQVLKLLKL